MDVKLVGVVAAVVVLVVAGAFVLGAFGDASGAATANRPVKIGIITDLTGPAAYWGSSTRLGAEIAGRELAAEGTPVELVYEDYKLDSKAAVTAAQKLVEVDGVDALYAEFNPATIPVGAYAKDKGVVYLLDSAAESPINQSQLAFKTYLDYRAVCRDLAAEFKSQGVARMGLLKGSMEFGELCLDGVREVYPDVAVAEFNIGDSDLSAQVLKLKHAGVQAIIHPGFEADVLGALKAIREQGFVVRYGTLDEVMTPNVVNAYADELNNSLIAGFPAVSPGFKSKLVATGEKLSTDNGAGLAYTHVKQLARALYACDRDEECAARKLAESPADDTIGFKGFVGRVAQFDLTVRSGVEFVGG